MSTTTVQFPEVVLPPTELIESDGVPLESDWHRLAMTLLIELVGLHFKGREDYFVGGNMFIYFNVKQARDRDFRGPDFFYVQDVPLDPPRPYWAIWDEGGKYPDVIMEFESPSTAAEDHGIKKQTYERVFRTSEYFIYVPAGHKLRGWRLVSGRYEEIQANENGWLWSERLGLWIGAWSGKYQGKEEVYPRFFDKDGNFIHSGEERAAMEKQKADDERLTALAEKQRAESEKKRADAEKQRADAERQRAESAEAELARLKAQMKD